MKILVCKSVVEIREVPVASKTKDNKMWGTIPATIFNDAICECPGYIFRGYCSHVTEVDENRCMWHSTDTSLSIDRCPNCNSEVIIYELESEYPRGSG